MKKRLAVAVGAAAIAATVLAPSAQAQLSWHTRSIIYWTGTSCIQMNSPGGSGTACGGSWEVPQQVYRGQDFGVDPVMGNASWISCEIWVEGELAYMDHAFAGDGTDVNCLRTKS
jgi:hypothetical protein